VQSCIIAWSIRVTLVLYDSSCGHCANRRPSGLLTTAVLNSQYRFGLDIEILGLVLAEMVFITLRLSVSIKGSSYH